MADKTAIEWADASWTSIKARVKHNAAEIAEAKGYTSLIQIAKDMAGHVGCHCEKVSDGCAHCYSATFQARCLPNNGTGLPFDRRSRDLVDVFLDEAELLKPLKWKRPRKIFVCSQTDWCAEFVTDEMRGRMLAIAAMCPQHTFLFLTKRAERCAEYFSRHQNLCSSIVEYANIGTGDVRSASWINPLPNVFIGFSAENQECFDARWSHMRKLALTWNVWLSAEPLLSAIDISAATHPGRCRAVGPMPENFQCGLPEGHEPHNHSVLTPTGSPWFGSGTLSWAVVGGESGHGARPMNIAWARSIVGQCANAGVACFVKQMGAKPEEEVTAPRDGHKWMRRVVLKDRKGGDMSEWPEDLRVREFPERRGMMASEWAKQKSADLVVGSDGVIEQDAFIDLVATALDYARAQGTREGLEEAAKVAGRKPFATQEPA